MERIKYNLDHHKFMNYQDFASECLKALLSCFASLNVKIFFLSLLLCLLTINSSSRLCLTSDVILILHDFGSSFCLDFQN